LADAKEPETVVEAAEYLLLRIGREPGHVVVDVSEDERTVRVRSSDGTYGVHAGTPII
jgi:hypothetical protein